MQQAVSAFEPLHAAHAIEQVMLAVGFASEVDDPTLAQLVAELDKFANELPGNAAIEPVFSFSVGPGGAVQLGGLARSGPSAGVTRQKVKPDGTLEAQVRVARNELVFITNAYTRWKNIIPNVIKYFDALLPIYLNKNRVMTTSLQYIDKFVWKGNSLDMRAEKLIKPDSKFVAPFIFGLEDNWHCHTGAFLRPNPYTKRLYNVNIDANEMVFPPNLKRRTINIFTLLRDHFYIDGYQAPPIAQQTASKVFEMHAEELHTVAKDILSDIISAEMVQRIQLNAP